MHILILSGSNRKNGNTELICDAFARGAAGQNTVEIVSVRDYDVRPCIGCDVCFQTRAHTCARQDDMSKIYEKLQRADMVVAASPVYLYGISAQLKAIIDRLHNPIRQTFSVKRAALFSVATATMPEVFDAVKREYELILNYFHLEDAGQILVGGVKYPGDIRQTDALERAFAFGQSLR